jgi:hypothetical protein
MATNGDFEMAVDRFVSDSDSNVLHTVTLSSDGMSYTLSPAAESNCNDNYTSAHK